MNVLIISDMGYNQLTNMHLFQSVEYIILLRLIDNCHWKLFYDKCRKIAIYLTNPRNSCAYH